MLHIEQRTLHTEQPLSPLLIPAVCTGAPEDWDPAEGLGPEQLADMERDYLEQLQRRRASQDPPRDKWITPLLDWQVGVYACGVCQAC